MRVTPLEDWIMEKSGINEREPKMLEKYQIKKIKETLFYVKKNSRFYREKLSSINEDKINTLSDFSRIPFTLPHHIGHNPFDFLCVPQKEVKRIITITSSGTTGEEKRIFFTEADLDSTVDFFKYGFKPMLSKQDRVLVLFPGNSYGSVGDVIKKSLNASDIESFVQGVMVDPDATANFILNNRINAIVAIPMQVLYFSRVHSELFKKNIDKVLLSADYVPEVLIRELSSEYGCKVFTHYGSSEMGYGGGVECEALNGYHLREADIYFEIINPDTGKLVEDGQYGEIVFTTLTRQAMPLIRYRTGDIASFSSAPCECRTFLRSMTRALGRIDNSVKISEHGFICLRELDEIIFKFKEVLDYKACITDPDLLKIEIVSKHKSIQEDVYQSIKRLLCDKLGYKIDLTVIANPDSMPEKIINSMVKRKINDFRRAVI
ncbi:MAG: DVU_1553 family AMP-dependent CoA ligase [Syntrophomonadaceae bacterium]|jgi:phenylacetate-CoA ligase